MSASASDAERVIALVLDREPTRLRELEDLIGVTFERNALRPWRAVCPQSVAGISALAATFVGDSLVTLAADPDPELVRYQLRSEGVDVDALATSLLGEGRRWRRGAGEFSTSGKELYWELRAPVAPARSDADRDELVERIATLVDRDPTQTAIEETFGPLRIDGRAPSRVVYGPTWALQVMPHEGAPRRLRFELAPALPCAPLFAALGWRDIIVGRFGGHYLALHSGSHVRPFTAYCEAIGVFFDTALEIQAGDSFVHAFRDEIAMTRRIEVAIGARA